MQHLAVSSDWLSIDSWIAEAMDQSTSFSYIEADIVDCILFWSGKHSIKGASSRDALAKSLEAVRILVSLGIDYHLGELRSNCGGVDVRIRDLFKAPFTRLKSLGSRTSVDNVLGVEAEQKPLEALSAYWRSENIRHFDSRLYSMVCGVYERAVANAIMERELWSILRRLVRITGIPFPIGQSRAVEDSVSVVQHIRTIVAIYLNRIQRPTKLRRVTGLQHDSSFKGFEPLTKVELRKIHKNAALAGSQRSEMNRSYLELIQQLDISEDAAAEMGFGHADSWTDYMSLLWDEAQKSTKAATERTANECEIDPLEIFESYFVVAESLKDTKGNKANEDGEILSDLEHIFIEPDIEYSSRQLVERSGMPKDHLARLLRMGEKRGFICTRKDGIKKLYRLKPI